MKNFFVFLAAIALLCVQNAGAWGYKSAFDGWSAVLTGFATQQHLYTPAQVDEPNQWDVLMATNPGAGFNITQDDYGNGMRLYVGLNGIAATSANTIVRAVVKWDNTANTMYTNPTVVIPDGKIYVMVDGVKYPMTNKGNYQFEAIVQVSPTTTALTVLGDPVNPTAITPDNGLTSGAVPTSVDLLIPNVPVTATANKIRVQFNLWYNQVTVSDFLSSICNFQISNAGNATTFAYLSAETNAQGQVIITISPYTPSAETPTAFTSFRNLGWNDGRFATLTVNGNANTAFKYFTRTVPGTTVGTYGGGPTKTQLIMTPVTGMVKEGDVIKFPSGSNSLEWSTPGNGNIYVGVTLPDYVYGTNCTGIYALKLATPTNVAVDANGVLTFVPVTNANQYVVTVTLNGIVIKTQTVSGSGTTLTAPLNGTASVTVQASDNTGTYAISDASAPASWTINNPDQTVGVSNFCESPFGSGNTAMTLSIETTSTGDIQVKIADPASWRGGGMAAASWVVAGLYGLFDEVTTALENPQVFRPKAGVTIPKGTLISYDASKGSIEWNPNNGYINTGTPIVNYIYGTACTAPQLNPPTNLALDGSNTLTFTPDPNAASTTVQIMSGSTVLMTITNFVSGTPINFPINGSFTIEARSITGSSAYSNSDWSSTIPLIVNLPNGTVGTSAYCQWQVDPTGAGTAGNDGTGAGYGTDIATDDIVQFTWVTDGSGNIVVTIIGVSGAAHDGTTTTFRGGSFTLANFSIGGVPAASLVTMSGGGAGSTSLTLTPVAGISIPKGTPITYSGIVAYAVVPTSDLTGLDNLWPTLTFNYAYGSVCTTSTSEIIENQNIILLNTITENNLYFNNAENANVVINDLSGKTVFRTKVSNSQINVSSLAAGIYLLNIDNQNFKFIRK